mgnify:CR=1 FL=1
MIDARTHHDPAKAPGLIAQAAQVAGSTTELSRRLGVSRDTLYKLQRGENTLTYTMQVALEQIIKDAC